MKILNSQLSILNLAAVLAFLFGAAAAGPVSHFGMLKVCGNNICGSNTGTASTPVLLKGPSLYWSNTTGAAFYNLATIDWLVDNMEIGIVRAAMAIRWYGNGENTTEDISASGISGYYFDPDKQESLINTVVEAAILNDIYVIVDWHSHNAHESEESAKAVAFFGKMAEKYKDVPNIIWEIYNEPIGANAGQITTYANSVVNAIRDKGSNNLVLVGSRSWSQNPSEQASNMFSGNSGASTAQTRNVAFTFHFYAAEGGGNGHNGVMTSANSARTNGFAVFGSEWGFTEASGKGTLNEGTKWTDDWMDVNNISNCNWSVSNSEASSIFTTGTNTGNMSTSRLSSSGGYFQTYMGKNKWTSKIPSSHPRAKDVKASVTDGSSVTLSATDLGLTGAITSCTEPEFGEVSIAADGKSITYKTADRGSKDPSVRFIYKTTQNNVTIQNKIVVDINNRRPILPEKEPIAVSRRVPTDITIGTGSTGLSISDPAGSGAQFTEVSISPSSAGTVEIKANKTEITFTPASSLSNAELTTVATLSYTARSGTSGPTNSATVDLHIKNLAPTIRNAAFNSFTSYTNMPNTGPIGIGIKQFNGNDRDGDPLQFVDVYLDPQYPGELQKVKADSFVYIPPSSGATGRVSFLAVITDGSLESPVGMYNINLQGTGTPIGDKPYPEMPGYTPIISLPAGGGSFGLKSLGQGRIGIHLEQSGHAKLEVYSLSGKNMGTLLNGFQSAGSSEISLKSLNLQRGVYILRLKQGSQVKTLRVVN
jgi:hypothetical protein